MTKTITNSTIPTFEELLAKMLPHFRYFAGRKLRLRRDNFDDALQDLVGMALEIYRSLIRRGKEVFYTPIMRFAIKRYRYGRRFTGSNTTDVHSLQTQMLGRCKMRSLDEMDEDDPSTRYFMEDKQSNVFHTAQLRMDFSDWYERQSVRDQWIVSDLAKGESTNVVAKRYGVSASLISIKRKNFFNSWKNFIDPPEGKGMLVPA